MTYFNKLKNHTATRLWLVAIAVGALVLTGNLNAQAQPPAPPSGLNLSNITNSQMSLSWSASIDPDHQADQLSYQIFRDNNPIATTTPGSLLFADTGLSTSTPYSYTLVAIDPEGNRSSTSTAISATTTASDTPPAANPPDEFSGNMGWMIVPLRIFEKIQSPSTTPASTGANAGITYDSYGYPKWNGNYITCEGFIDNDPAHHTKDPNDKDPAHNIGKNCPGGKPKVPTQAAMSMWENGIGFNFWMTNGQNPNREEWVVIPLNRENMENLHHLMMDNM
jgi:hypothetical protein